MKSLAKNNRLIAKNSLYMSIRMIVVLCISLYTTRCILDVLGVQDYGIYNIVAGFVTMFTILNSGMSSATQRFYNYELGLDGEKGANIVYNSAFWIHLLLAIITVVCAELFGMWYIENKMIIPADRLIAAKYVFHFSVISMFFSIINVPYSSAIMAHERMNFYAFVGIIDALLKLLIVILISYSSSDKLILYSALFLCVSVLNFFFYFFYSKKEFDEIILRKCIEKKMFLSMLSYSGWSLFGAFAYMMREQGVNLVLNAFFGPIINAAKGVSNQVNGALTSFSSNLIVPSRPQVIQSYAMGEINRTFNLTYSVSKLSCIFFYMMALPICLEIDFILNLWLGDNIPDHANTFIIIILITNTFGVLVTPISTVVHATGKVKFYSLLTSFSNILSVPLAYVFLIFDEVPELVFIALFITMITNHISGLYSLYRIVKFSIKSYVNNVILPILKVVFLSLPLNAIFLLLMNDCILRFFLIIITSLISICIITYVFALDLKEKKILKNLITKFFKLAHG